MAGSGIPSGRARRRESQKGAPRLPVEQKVQVMLSVLGGELSVVEATRRYGVSTLTVSRWRERFVNAGKAGLAHNPMPVPTGRPEVPRCAGYGRKMSSSSK